MLKKFMISIARGILDRFSRHDQIIFSLSLLRAQEILKGKK